MARMARPGDEVALIPDSSQGDRDVYGRLLRYVEEAGTDYGREMIRRGRANLYQTQAPIRRLRPYSKARREAKRKDRGVWGKCDGDFHSSN
jgi:micrococcal nuclease